MPTPSNATPLPLRCAAMLCPCTANQSRAFPLLSAAMRPLCLAMHCHARASPITAFAVPIIAVTMLCVASPAQCWAILCRRCALPRKAIAERCPALPSLICAYPRPCAALRCPALPTLSWSILRLAARRLAMLRLRVPCHFIAGAHPALRFPSAALSFPSPGQRISSLRLCCTGPLGAIHCPRISVLSVSLPMPSHAKQRHSHLSASPHLAGASQVRASPQLFTSPSRLACAPQSIP